MRAAGETAPAAEMAYELTYRAAINARLAIQPDIQWLRNHGEAPTKDAVVLGVRFDFTF